MAKWNIPLLEIGGRKVKLIQGGMGVGISGANLASAVANEGGLGVIASVGLNEIGGYSGKYEESSARALGDEIKLARSKTNNKGALGINILRALTNYESLVRTSADAGIDFIISGAGLPLDLPSYLGDNKKTKLIPIVSSARAAGIIIKTWKKRYDYALEGIIVEGPKAGGHLGFKPEQIFDSNCSLEKLIPEVVDVVRNYESERKIPVVAAGGIYYGGDIKKFLELGASGVQMATRFVTTEECDADIRFKQAYIDCKKDDLVIIESPVGMPGRAIKNKFLQKVKDGKMHPVECPYYCLITCAQKDSPYCIARALVEARAGKFDNGFVFAGANAHLCKEIIPVRRVFEKLNQEYLEGKVSE
jgi:nitronate monooxygenase